MQEDTKHALQSQKATQQQPRAPSSSQEDQIIFDLFEIYEVRDGVRTSILRTNDRDRAETVYNQLRTKGPYQIHVVLPSKMNEA